MVFDGKYYNWMDYHSLFRPFWHTRTTLIFKRFFPGTLHFSRNVFTSFDCLDLVSVSCTMTIWHSRYSYRKENILLRTLPLSGKHSDSTGLPWPSQVVFYIIFICMHIFRIFICMQWFCQEHIQLTLSFSSAWAWRGWGGGGGGGLL